jgi:arylsulfatase A-like enzyme
MPHSRRELLLASLAAASCSQARKSRPNILFVMTDDHAAGHLGCYGNKLVRTEHIDRLAQSGARFANAFVTNSLCAPSRATILSGAYSHVHGIRGNSEAKDAIEHFDPSIPTYPELLQKAGYKTAIAGKWHLSHDPKGFDSWCVLPGQGLYFDPEFIDNGTKKKFPGYATDVTTDLALNFLKQQSAAQPWCLVYQHKAPHRPFLPASRHAKLYDKIEIPHPPAYDDDYKTRRLAAEAEDMRFDVSLAPDYKDLPKNLTPKQRKDWIFQRFVKDYYGAIAGVDENLGRVLRHLDEQKMTQDTVIIYTTDNGFFVGDHGWYDKRFMYEPSLRVPLVIQAPGARAGQVLNQMAMNIDIAPTILDYAGVPVPETMQGRSLRPLLEGGSPKWRDDIYYAYYENSWVLHGKGKEAMSDPSFQFFTPHRVNPHRGIRTATHKLIEYYAEGNYWELFDLAADPHELHNLAGQASHAAIEADLRTRLAALRKAYRDTA